MEARFFLEPRIFDTDVVLREDVDSIRVNSEGIELEHSQKKNRTRLWRAVIEAVSKTNPGAIVRNEYGVSLGVTIDSLESLTESVENGRARGLNLSSKSLPILQAVINERRPDYGPDGLEMSQPE